MTGAHKPRRFTTPQGIVGMNYFRPPVLADVSRSISGGHSRPEPAAGESLRRGIPTMHTRGGNAVFDLR